MFGLNKTQLGKYGEQKAVEYLSKKGYTIIETNYFERGGELDIVAKEKDEIVFIEVKTCSCDEVFYSFPEESVNKTKQKRLLSTANGYLEKKNLWHTDFRFDIITVEIGRDGAVKNICHFENALED